jgi:DNA-binding CsgD family transcriptional regulator
MTAAIDTLADRPASAVAVPHTESGTAEIRCDALDAVLAGRDAELHRIRRFLAEARDGRGRALVFEGPAGIGKTALLAAGRRAAEDEGFRVLRARGAELEREFSFGVVRQLVEPLLADGCGGERAALLEGPAGLAARLLDLPGAPGSNAEPAPLAPDPSFAVLHGLYWLCANLASRGPVLLAVDDAHWADGASLRFLAFLLPRLDELRLALLLTTRDAEPDSPEDLIAALTMDAETQVVTVQPLGAGAVATLIAAGLGSDPEPGFVTACREATGGNPFLVRRLVAALGEQGIEPVEAMCSRVQRLASVTAGRWALRQLGRLGPDAARLARAVAVLERADLSEAAALAHLDAAVAGRAAELLVRAGVLEEPPLAFAHQLLRTAVYGAMSAMERAEAHRQAARLLAEGHAGGERVAEHLLATAPCGDDWVVEQLRTAAQAATASGAPESAAAYLRRALEEPPPPDVRARLLVDLGAAEFRASHAGWEEHLTAAVAAADDDTIRAGAALRLATALGLQQRVVDMVEVCDRTIARLDGNDPEARWLLETLAVMWGMSDAVTAPSLAKRAHSLIVAAREQSVSPQVLAVAGLQAVLANEPADSAAELARRAFAAGPRALPGPAHGPWFTPAVLTLLLIERFGEAQAFLDAPLVELRAAAGAASLPPILYLRAALALRRGDLLAAEADARSLLGGEGLAPPRMWRVLTGGVLMIALVERAELEAAERALEPLAPDLEGTGFQAASLRHARGRLRLARRHFAAALSDFAAAGDLISRTGWRAPAYLPWRSDAALAHLGLGEQEEARRLASEELELARHFGAPRALGIAMRAAGLATGGRQGEQLLREAIELLDGPDTRLEQGRVQADLGALLRRGNRRVEARELLRQALDAAHRCGARALALLADDELRATGARPLRVVLTGLEALTGSERRVAEMAADGLTNRQIAQSLFVSVGTVETHLSRVFSKLDLRTRAGLGRALRAAPAGG